MPNVKTLNKPKGGTETKSVFIPSVFFTSTAVQITVDPVAFRKWRVAQTKANALKASADTLRTLAGIPDSKGLALMLGVELKPDAFANAIFVDSAGNPVGKLSVFYMPEKVIPACFSNRIS